MKAGYDRLLLVFLRTVSASIRITPPPFFKQQSLLFSSLSSRFRYCSATVSRSPLPDEDDLFRRHAKLSRLLFHRFLAPLSNIELCILLFSSQTLFAIFLKKFSFATHSSSKSSRTLLRFLKRFSSRHRNLSWKTLGEIEHIYIIYKLAGTKLVFRDFPSGGRIKIHTTNFSRLKASRYQQLCFPQRRRKRVDCSRVLMAFLFIHYGFKALLSSDRQFELSPLFYIQPLRETTRS